MNNKVKEFLDAKKDAEKKKYEEEKQKTLIELGLFEKIYSPDNNYSEEYSSYEWDSVNSTNKYYKKVMFEITDEEYEEVKRYSKKEEVREKNLVATALTVIAWIVFIGGFIAGIILGNVEVSGYYDDYTEFSLAAAFIYWSASLISGTMFLGFAEIIKLLDAIKKR